MFSIQPMQSIPTQDFTARSLPSLHTMPAEHGELDKRPVRAVGLSLSYLAMSGPRTAWDGCGGEPDTKRRQPVRRLRLQQFLHPRRSPAAWQTTAFTCWMGTTTRARPLTPCWRWDRPTFGVFTTSPFQHLSWRGLRRQDAGQGGGGRGRGMSPRRRRSSSTDLKNHRVTPGAGSRGRTGRSRCSTRMAAISGPGIHRALPLFMKRRI